MYAFAWLEESFSLRLAVTLLHFLWQGAALALLVVVAGWLFSRAAAQVRYAVNVTAMLALVCCLPVTFALLVDAHPTVSVVKNSSNHLDGLPVLRYESGHLDGEGSRPPGDIPSNGSPVGADAATSMMPHENPALLAAHRIDLDATNGMATSSQLRRWLSPVAPYLIGAYFVGVVMMVFRLATGLWGGHKL
jgi:hypothetical protein